MEPIKIGIDVGGTNTDAVIMQGTDILATHKSPTSPDVTAGIKSAIETVLQHSKLSAPDVDVVIIGTTHFINAIVERKELAKVAAIRLCLPAASGLPPYSGWPETLTNTLGKTGYLVAGGFEYDGTPISPLDEPALKKIAAELKNKNINNVAITGIFSQIDVSMENRARDILLAEIPDLKISLSHHIGRLGMLERENATILNASLLSLADKVVNAFADSIKQTGITAPFYITQNDGTLMNERHTMQYPILTCASGCTNSMRGAAYLAGTLHGIVVDIGGTTSDIGVLIDGFPRVASSWIELGGVRTNFPIPDTHSLALGGGTKIIETPQGEIQIGPHSVGYRIVKEALIFGGNVLTASDIAVANHHATVGDETAVAHLEKEFIDKVIHQFHQIILDGSDRMKSSDAILPLILVGGGTLLLSEKHPLFQHIQVIRPPHAEVANAVGAAIAQVSGIFDKIVSYDKIPRETALENAAAQATAHAIENAGIPDSIRVSEVEEIPIPNLPGNLTRLRVKVVGDLNVAKATRL